MGQFSARCSSAILAIALVAASSTAAAQRSHTVRAGQSLSLIARRYHTNVFDLATANELRGNPSLRPGQSLIIPPAGITYVRPGQTLSHVAHDHQCTVDELVRLNRLRRGSGIRAGQRLILPGYAATDAASPREDWGEPTEAGRVRIRRQGELLEARFVDEGGRVTREALETLAQVMRRQDDDAPELPNPRLALLLAAISDHFGGREIEVVSGRREAGGYTRESSRHTSGHATDIRVDGVPRREVWDYCRTLSDTGCGFYPRSTFVHVDVRSLASQWVDWSSPGVRQRYGNLSGPWRRFCRDSRRRGHRLCAREGRRVSRPDEVAAVAILTPEASALIPAVPLPASDDPADLIDEYETAVDDDETPPEVPTASHSLRPFGG